MSERDDLIELAEWHDEQVGRHERRSTSADFHLRAAALLYALTAVPLRVLPAEILRVLPAEMTDEHLDAVIAELDRYAKTLSHPLRSGNALLVAADLIQKLRAQLSNGAAEKPTKEPAALGQRAMAKGASQVQEGAADAGRPATQPRPTEGDGGVLEGWNRTTDGTIGQP